VSLPREKRQTGEQAAAFALKAIKKLERAKSVDFVPLATFAA
jgi:hypothetical protein